MISLLLALAQLLQGGATTGQVIAWNGTQFSPGVYGNGGSFSSATLVTYTHNLLSSNVQVYVYDGNGVRIEPKEVFAFGLTVVVTFDSATSGRIVVK